MKFLTFALSFLAAFGACATFGREYSVAYLARGSELSAFTSLAYHLNVPEAPLSSRGMRDLFTTCASVQQGLIYSLQPSETQAGVDATCAGLARAALAMAPSFGSAHTILMLSTSVPADVMASMVNSKLTASNETGDARLRLLKGLPLGNSGHPAVDQILGSDIALLVLSVGGRAWLAKLYKGDATARLAIASGIESQSNETKTVFLQEVRRLGTN